MKKILTLLISFCLTACGLGGSGGNDVQKYGDKVSYEGGKVLKYPDFTVRYAGTHEKSYPTDSSAKKMVFYDFEVVKDNKKQTVSWSSGTGDIGPAFFYIGEADYVLEMKQSDVLKTSIADGNIVIWKRADYEEAVKKK